MSPTTSGAAAKERISTPVRNPIIFGSGSPSQRRSARLESVKRPCYTGKKRRNNKNAEMNGHADKEKNETSDNNRAVDVILENANNGQDEEEQARTTERGMAASIENANNGQDEEEQAQTTERGMAASIENANNGQDEEEQTQTTERGMAVLMKNANIGRDDEEEQKPPMLNQTSAEELADLVKQLASIVEMKKAAEMKEVGIGHDHECPTCAMIKQVKEIEKHIDVLEKKIGAIVSNLKFANDFVVKPKKKEKKKKVRAVIIHMKKPLEKQIKKQPNGIEKKKKKKKQAEGVHGSQEPKETVEKNNGIEKKKKKNAETTCQKHHPSAELEDTEERNNGTDEKKKKRKAKNGGLADLSEPVLKKATMMNGEQQQEEEDNDIEDYIEGEDENTNQEVDGEEEDEENAWFEDEEEPYEVYCPLCRNVMSGENEIREHECDISTEGILCLNCSRHEYDWNNVFDHACSE